MATKSVWQTLSAIDCSKHTEQKGQFTYLSWTWAWAMVKERYPNAMYTIEDDLVYSDGTMEVRCTVEIEGLSHTMWLPVLDHRNKPIAGPNAFDINSARMRVLVKTLAFHGLGHYIYAGESFPPNAPEYTDAQKKEYDALLKKGVGLDFLSFLRGAGDKAAIALHNSFEDGDKVAGKKRAAELEKEGHSDLDQYAEQITAAIENGDTTALELAREVGESGQWAKAALWSRLTPETQHKFGELSKGAAA